MASDKSAALKKVRQAADRARRAQADYEKAAQDLREAVREAEDDHSFGEIASVTGLSRQRLHQIARSDEPPHFPPRRRGDATPAA